MSFCSINIHLHFLFARQNANEVWFNWKVQNKIQIDPKKKPLKGCKTNNKIQTDKNIERVQDKQQDTNKEKKKRFWNGIWSMTNYNSKWLCNCHNDNHQNINPRCKQNILYNTCYLVFYLKIRKNNFLNF
jgi:hypothetical protein